ncbi:hypothetical protein AMJ87_12665 [candidate division WOR_3 bacterium SM23_60]|uniref:Uncharacterized protein n=1 Tax=candidate division WOR_3 bacterium SM23_60 TaxID=1703780 RepID=A0A0S8G5X8_UNCW3|nr:MAG: hypothetical protein AMJ87_12665 [candidate division WOR_3 bacterium SM23_60]
MNILYNYSHAIFTAKRFIACVLVLLLLLNCAPRLTHYREYGLKLPLTISHRVGDVVDAAERLEFDLLRGIDDFVYAEYYAIFTLGQSITSTEISRVKLLCAALVGGTVSGAIMFFPSFILALYACDFSLETGCKRSGVLGWVTFLGVFGLSVAGGAAGGNSIDKRNALRSIKEARRPYRVE